ncbi:hypothetical protein BJ508DRAFT_415840 [Ascobolus immersus RN42]|uniref:Uncharacterized protein n=1 Tax=Ascobolus immersus RN42 TaxID=1160509 RepID=A0A3N4I5X0_ASCIM|nr:hypothetical protein BJ508DRAFT_415840 [Ascobolus immersus RN42]
MPQANTQHHAHQLRASHWHPQFSTPSRSTVPSPQSQQLVPSRRPFPRYRPSCARAIHHLESNLPTQHPSTSQSLTTNPQHHHHHLRNQPTQHIPSSPPAPGSSIKVAPPSIYHGQYSPESGYKLSLTHLPVPAITPYSLLPNQEGPRLEEIDNSHLSLPYS